MTNHLPIILIAGAVFAVICLVDVIRRQGKRHQHAWTDWIVTDRGSVLYAGQPVGWYSVQERHCTTCGKTEIDDQANYGGHGKGWCIRRPEMTKRAPRKDGVSA